jgi:pseudaminic acid biosynthesis-associated methylase
VTKTENEISRSEFWRGGFGDSYSDRNDANVERIHSRTGLWAQILKSTDGAPPQSILEVGANIGNNLRALGNLTNAAFHALEPNQHARDIMVSSGVTAAANVYDGLARSIPLPDSAVDMAFTSGVLIHIGPGDLLPSCQEIHRVARRYIVCIEYFSDKEESIKYRGQDDVLFKRDFGGFWLDNFPDLRVLDYGFAWKRLTGLDNLTWWVFDKTPQSTVDAT